MGNRCVITTKENFKNNGVGVYLHWNGGRDSVEAFLKYMELRGFRSPKEDESYAWARLCQVIGNYFGGGLSIGVDKVNRLDTDSDNGTYLIDGWNIVGRKNFEGCVEQNEYDLKDMLFDIDSCQPVGEQLGRDFLSADKIHPNYIHSGDLVYVKDIDDKYKTYVVAGKGRRGRMVNGRNVTDIPYVARYAPYEDNINNYLLNDSYHVIRCINSEPFETRNDIDLLF